MLAGDAETGVCLMQLEAGLDTGPVFAVREVPIEPDETAGELRGRLVDVGTRVARRAAPDDRERDPGAPGGRADLRREAHGRRVPARSAARPRPSSTGSCAPGNPRPGRVVHGRRQAREGVAGAPIGAPARAVRTRCDHGRRRAGHGRRWRSRSKRCNPKASGRWPRDRVARRAARRRAGRRVTTPVVGRCSARARRGRGAPAHRRRRVRAHPRSRAARASTISRRAIARSSPSSSTERSGCGGRIDHLLAAVGEASARLARSRRARRAPARRLPAVHRRVAARRRSARPSRSFPNGLAASPTACCDRSRARARRGACRRATASMAIGTRTSHPDWIVQSFIDELGTPTRSRRSTSTTNRRR